MPTLEELRIKHRYAEKSTAALVNVPDILTDEERGGFEAQQQEYKDLTSRGLKERWLHRAPWGRQTVRPATSRRHPTRKVDTHESVAEYSARVQEFAALVEDRLEHTVANVLQAAAVVNEWSWTTVTIDRDTLRESARPKVEKVMRAEGTVRRRSGEIADVYTADEWASFAASIQEWQDFQARGLAEGWLITKAHVVVGHPLDVHPNRNVQLLESDAVVAARVAGLDRYLAARVSA